MRLTLLVFGSASPFTDFCLSQNIFLSFIRTLLRFYFARSSVMQQYSCGMSYETSPRKLNAKAAVEAVWMLWFALCLRLAELQPSWALNATISLLDSVQRFESAQWTLLWLGPKFGRPRCGKNANCEMNDSKLSFNTNWCDSVERFTCHCHDSHFPLRSLKYYETSGLQRDSHDSTRMLMEIFCFSTNLRNPKKWKLLLVSQVNANRVAHSNEC